jgi:hypothetical protein
VTPSGIEPVSVYKVMGKNDSVSDYCSVVDLYGAVYIGRQLRNCRRNVPLPSVMQKSDDFHVDLSFTCYLLFTSINRRLLSVLHRPVLIVLDYICRNVVFLDRGAKTYLPLGPLVE